ncbi:DEAD-box ATP-dependent RNA helicase 14-like protein [Tanacetum coccineum]|uniref:DEAD-box ATP-dependent RNA helicase 14-like protein n=1 Tax=Tanacetum coccineum TaxID=301880 RepID=A0ABQ5IPV7_9ASTR
MHACSRTCHPPLCDSPLSSSGSASTTTKDEQTLAHKKQGLQNFYSCSCTVGNNVPPPFTSFEESGFPSELLREVLQAGFTAPTPIQAQSWPIALRSRDVVVVAKTVILSNANGGTSISNAWGEGGAPTTNPWKKVVAAPSDS